MPLIGNSLLSSCQPAIQDITRLCAISHHVSAAHPSDHGINGQFYTSIVLLVHLEEEAHVESRTANIKVLVSITKQEKRVGEGKNRKGRKNIHTCTLKTRCKRIVFNEDVKKPDSST